MGWFSNFRERRRLAEEVKYLRRRVVVLEEKNSSLTNQLLERDFLWADRFLTSQVKTWAISDEANSRSAERERLPDSSVQPELKSYLNSRYNEILEDAKEANLGEVEADALYKKREPDFIEEFEFLNK